MPITTTADSGPDLKSQSFPQKLEQILSINILSHEEKKKKKELSISAKEKKFARDFLQNRSFSRDDFHRLCKKILAATFSVKYFIHPKKVGSKFVS